MTAFLRFFNHSKAISSLERDSQLHCLRTNCHSVQYPHALSRFVRESTTNTPKLISFGREYIDPRRSHAVLQKYKWKRTSAAPASLSSATRRRIVRLPLSVGTCDRRVLLIPRSPSALGRGAHSRPTTTRLSPLAERAQSRTTAISFSLPGCAPHGSPFSPVVEPDSLCALHNLFCNSTLRAALTGTPAAASSFRNGLRARVRVYTARRGMLPIKRPFFFLSSIGP